MIKKWQIGEQIHVHNRGDFRIIRELLVLGFETNIEISDWIQVTVPLSHF
jgi:hypothetical protein